MIMNVYTKAKAYVFGVHEANNQQNKENQEKM